MASFHLTSFGCRASQADGAALKRQLLGAGFREAGAAEDCDVVVLNTCTVTAHADAEVRQVVRHIHRANPRCRILVTGCYAQRAAEEISRLEGVAWVVGNSHKHTIVELLGSEVGDQGCGSIAPVDGSLCNEPGGGASVTRAEPLSHPSRPPIPGAPFSVGPWSPVPGARPRILVSEISDEFHFAPVFADDRTRPTLKVQDGCNARCSFCIIPEVRGRSRSLAPPLVIDEVQRLEGQGYKEVVLSGINLGSYGRDLGRAITFLDLVERILTQTAIQRLRLSSIEPMDVSRALIRLVASEPRLARHFHVPLQSGSDRILRAMNRRYWTSHYAERLLAIRDALPHAAIGADVMVGFPGETDDDHETSARFIRSLPFTYLHVFPFSARPGTPAAARPDQVDGRLAHERSAELRRLGAEKHQHFAESQIGRTISALTLDEASPDGRRALTTNYLKVNLPASPVPPNTLLDLHVTRLHQGALYGFPARQCSP